MKQFNPDEMRIENSVLETIKVKEFNREYGGHISLDVHKDNISIGMALPGRFAGNYRGEMANKPKTIHKLRHNEEFSGEVLLIGT